LHINVRRWEITQKKEYNKGISIEKKYVDYVFIHTIFLEGGGRDSPLVGLGLLLIHEDILWFLDHTHRHTTVGRTPLDE